jgi:hypothetical protein
MSTDWRGKYVVGNKLQKVLMNRKDFGEYEHRFICHDHLGGAGFGGYNVVVVVRHSLEFCLK